MKNRSGRLKKIVSLAAADERRESVALGQSQRALDEALDRLHALEGYRHDYAASRDIGGEVSAVRWADYQTFLGRLDEAVKAQRQLILEGEQSVDAHRQRWMTRRQRLDSLSRVLERYSRDERAEAERRTQRTLDDRPRPRDFYDPD